MFYKKPTFWFLIAALVALFATTIFPNMPIDANTGGRILVLLVSLVLGINIETGAHIFTGRPEQPFWKSRKFQLAAGGILTSLVYDLVPQVQLLHIDPTVINGLILLIITRILGIAIVDSSITVTPVQISLPAKHKR